VKHFGADGPFRHSQDLADLRARVPFHVEQHHREPASLRQLRERLPQPAEQHGALGDGIGVGRLR
jgi:hypothetical protein